MSGPQRRAIFRVDASSRVGTGHVMRCLTLAERLVAAGLSVGFACTAETFAIVPSVADRAELLEDVDGPLDTWALTGAGLRAGMFLASIITLSRPASGRCAVIEKLS